MNDRIIHSSPLWGTRATSTIDVDLSDSGMPNRQEVLPVCEASDSLFVVCCAPFFLYGVALGDSVTWNPESKRIENVKGGKHALLRIAIVKEGDTDLVHPEIHRWLESERLWHEWRNPRYVSIDIPPGRHVEIPTPLLQLRASGVIQTEVASQNE